MSIKKIRAIILQAPIQRYGFLQASAERAFPCSLPGYVRASLTWGSVQIDKQCGRMGANNAAFEQSAMAHLVKRMYAGKNTAIIEK